MNRWVWWEDRDSSLSPHTEQFTAADTFYIESYSQGFVIRPYGTTKAIYMTSTSTADLTTIDNSSTNTRKYWTFEQYTDRHRCGYSLEIPVSWRTKGIVVGSTTTVTLRSWSTYINANTPYLAEETGYENMGDFSWNDATYSATFTAQNLGQVCFRCASTYPDGTADE